MALFLVCSARYLSVAVSRPGGFKNCLLASLIAFQVLTVVHAQDGKAEGVLAEAEQRATELIWTSSDEERRVVSMEAEERQ